MKYSILVFLIILSSFFSVSAQVDSAIGQISNSNTLSFAGGISGDGRLVVFESLGNVATVNPRNADGNREIFLFDYAQRRIFQITDTKSLLTVPAGTTNLDNVKVEIVNIRPVISNDGRWIAFGSNATTSRPGTIDGTNPGSFNANTVMNGAMLTEDGNTEIWLYQIPAVTPVDLSIGAEIPFVDLNVGTFTQATNTIPSRFPSPGTTTSAPVIADDNGEASISDDGSIIAFVSNRELAPCATTPTATCGNSFPDFDNDEIFTYVRTPGNLQQITATPRGAIGAPIFNANPTISGNGSRVAFISNANNAVVGMTAGGNTDLSEEIYYTDLTAGSPVPGTAKQITQTTKTNPGDVVNILNFGRRMSRDGRYIAFDSYAELTATGTGVSTTSFALYLFDTTTNVFKIIGPRSNADASLLTDGAHFPSFSTTFDAAGAPVPVMVFTTRLNINSAGTVPPNVADGLNPDATRPPQIYYYDLTATLPTLIKRLTKLPAVNFSQSFVPQPQAWTSNTVNRMTFTFSLTELGSGNEDLLNEAFYYLLPEKITDTAGSLSYATGASRLPVTIDPVPTPSPTASPSPTPTPTGSPSPTPTPRPPTPPAVQGTSPGSLAVVNFISGINQPVTPRTAVGSLDRQFSLPIQLSGVTMTINGVAVGLKSVSSREIIFVVPTGLFASRKYPVVINNNGVIIRGMITISDARPDIFNFNDFPSPHGRARIFNATNRVLTTEPFTVTTLKFRGGRRVPTVLRLYLTGVQSVTRAAAIYTIRIGDVQITGNNILSDPVLVEPGVYTIDFQLPPELNMAGDVPIVLTITGGGLTFSSRLDDTAPRLRIL